MNRIQDKKLWFAVHCGKQHVVCSENSSLNIGAALGLLGLFVLGLGLTALLSHDSQGLPELLSQS
jgi:hypothetical protein